MVALAFGMCAGLLVTLEHRRLSLVKAGCQLACRRVAVFIVAVFPLHCKKKTLYPRTD
jgi:hypothetical protein